MGKSGEYCVEVSMAATESAGDETKMGRPRRERLEKSLLIELARLTGCALPAVAKRLQPLFTKSPYALIRSYPLTWPAHQTMMDWSRESECRKIDRRPHSAEVARELRIHVVGISTFDLRDKEKYREMALAYEPRFGSLFMKCTETFEPIDKDNALTEFIHNSLDRLGSGVKNTIETIAFTNPVQRTATDKKVPGWYLAFGPTGPNTNVLTADRGLKMIFDQPTSCYGPLIFRKSFGTPPWSTIPCIGRIITDYNTASHPDSPFEKIQAFYEKTNAGRAQKGEPLLVHAAKGDFFFTNLRQ